MGIKSLVVAALAAGVVLGTTACDPSDTPKPLPTTAPGGQTTQPTAQPTRPGEPTQPGQPNQPGGSTPGTTDAPVPTTGAPAGDPTTTKAPAGTAKCTTSQLILDKGHGGQIGGTWFLKFINKSSTACTLEGFPGVSQTNGPQGDPVGEPAERDKGPQAPQATQVTLSANGGAAQFEFISYPKQVNDCAALRTSTLRVYPPDNTESLSLPWDNLICPSPQRMLVVRAITPM
ncbi:DUF4232 domain-containing protein [Nocardia sp. CA-145437]|uniref:DUF4232 domain-containing protein n=1 Tax=Nocardia sp. CA-145437 TaxID=3239980 RepID=UPI003D96904C